MRGGLLSCLLPSDELVDFAIFGILGMMLGVLGVLRIVFLGSKSFDTLSLGWASITVERFCFCVGYPLYDVYLLPLYLLVYLHSLFI
ncbi:hypothetical protein BJ508DRAFT_182285 [Ascobolus immersus RN42]|uniref:Uncharacterized protein n=1 Tax=Ascobolus immersus RN42 TaxID=1160509 RepID=A0A3N4HTI6_ASCIM|nr:hypothetical protein BJ508DRAFT_182285 [Ascobolus immersus RN42]